MSALKNSLIWKLILPVPIAVAVAIVAVWMFLPSLIADNARTEAVRSASQIANQYKTIRGYYTKNVVKKVVADGHMKPSFHHKKEAKSIPLPATFIHDVSALLQKEDTTIDLYSQFPFPVRGNRTLDDFQKEAWDFLNAKPDGTFMREETRDGREVVRVAIADRMVAKGCVDCHNSHPASPKTDWKLGDVRGILEVSTAIEPQLAAGAALSNKVVLVGLVGGLLLIVISVLLARSVTSPIKRMTDAMNRLASGDASLEIPDTERPDEIGAMANAVQVFKENALDRERLEADGQAQQEASEQRAQHQGELTAEFDEKVSGVIKALGQASTQMRSTAESMSATAEKTSQQAISVAAASDEATTNVQTVASASEELSASIGEINRQVGQSTEIAARANSEAEHTNETMQGLADAAQKIGEVVNLISDIAAQTNLLALNATIEAARAGEAGKGFAVVASEVKNLATQTGKATEEISVQIGEIQSVTSDAVSAIDNIGGTIKELSGIAETIASAVDEQGSATQEIAQNTHQAAAGTQQVSTTIGGVTQTASETGTAAQEVLEAAGELSNHADSLRSQVESFLSQMKAA